MSDRRLRPRAFRLDDEKIAVDDAPAPFSPTAIVKSEPAIVELEAPLGIDTMSEVGRVVSLPPKR